MHLLWMSCISHKVKVMFRVCTLSTDLGSHSLKRQQKKSFFPIPLFISLYNSSSFPLSHTPLQVQPWREIKRESKGDERRFRKWKRRLLLSLTHSQPWRDVFFQCVWQPNEWLGARSLSKSARQPHLRIPSQKFIRWHKNCQSMLMWLQNDDAMYVCLMCGWSRDPHTHTHTHP